MIDETRWRLLNEQLSEARSLLRGWRDEGNRVRQKLLEVQNELGRAEDKFRSRYGENVLPPAGARPIDYPPMPPGLKAGQTVRPGVNDYARPIVALREQAAELSAEAARIEERARPCREKFAELFALREVCIRWAGENGVVLPGSDDQRYTAATLPSNPAWQTDFTGPAAAVSAPDMSHADMMKAAADAEAQSAPSIFDKLGNAIGRWGG